MADEVSKPTKTSLLMDKTPPEIRLMIFRLALQSTQGVVRKRKDNPLPRFDTTSFVVDTSLFLVNRAVLQEARDAFYEANTVRIVSTFPDLDGNEGLRMVEIVDDLARECCIYNRAWQLDAVLDSLLQFPKLQTITIMCDKLNLRQRSAREFATSTFPDAEIRCVAIGVFEIGSATLGKIKIYLKNLEHTPNLPEAKRLASQMTLGELSERYIRAGSITYFLAEGLRWYQMHRIAEKNLAGIEADELSAVALRNANVRSIGPLSVPWKHVQLPEDKRLEDLTVEEDGMEVVEWATDLMALNLLQYRGSRR